MKRGLMCLLVMIALLMCTACSVFEASGLPQTSIKDTPKDEETMRAEEKTEQMRAFIRSQFMNDAIEELSRYVKTKEDLVVCANENILEIWMMFSNESPKQQLEEIDALCRPVLTKILEEMERFGIDEPIVNLCINNAEGSSSKMYYMNS